MKSMRRAAHSAGFRALLGIFNPWMRSSLRANRKSAATTGPMGWLRENLFSGIFNSILTLLSIALIVYIVPGAIEWTFVNGVFNADNIRECRAVLAIPGLTIFSRRPRNLMADAMVAPELPALTTPSALPFLICSNAMLIDESFFLRIASKGDSSMEMVWDAWTICILEETAG